MHWPFSTTHECLLLIIPQWPSGLLVFLSFTTIKSMLYRYIHINKDIQITTNVLYFGNNIKWRNRHSNCVEFLSLIKAMRPEYKKIRMTLVIIWNNWVGIIGSLFVLFKLHRKSTVAMSIPSTTWNMLNT